MADGFPKGDPFHMLEGKDGFHIVKTECGDILTLSCMAYAGGVPYNLSSTDNPDDACITLKTVNNPTPADVGAMERLRLVLDGIARYFTTGGSWRELDMAMNAIETFIPSGLKFPGYHLLQTYSTTDGTYQHVFVKDDTNQAVLWQESEIGDSGLPVGGWIESTTLEKLKEQQVDDEEEDEEGGIEGDYGIGEAGQDEASGLLQLPTGPGVQSSEETQ